MKRVFTSPDTAEVGLLKNLLLQAELRCLERNEQLAQTLPAAPFQAELWVEDDEDYEEALALVRSWQHPPLASVEPWTCARCGELLAGEFTQCWKCGTNRELIA